MHGSIRDMRNIWLATITMKRLLLEAPWERQIEEEQDLNADCAQLLIPRDCVLKLA